MRHDVKQRGTVAMWRITRTKALGNPTVLPSKSHKTFFPLIYTSLGETPHPVHYCERSTDRPTRPTNAGKTLPGQRRERLGTTRPSEIRRLRPPVERDLEAVFQDLSSPLRPRWAGWMNRDPGNDLIRVFILGLGQDGAAGGKGKRGREERPQSFTRCDHMRYIIIQCGREARSKRATVTLLQGGEKSGGNPLWNSRRTRRTARRAFAHSDSTTWTCLASFFFSFRLFFFWLPKERKKENRPLSFLSSSGTLSQRETEISSHAARSAANRARICE